MPVLPAAGCPQLGPGRPQLGPGRSDVCVEVAFLPGKDFAVRAKVSLRVGQVSAATKEQRLAT